MSKKTKTRAARAERAAREAAGVPVETRGGKRRGAGRPASDPATRRSRAVNLRLTEGEYAALVALAELEDADDLSTWLRERLLGAKVTP